MKRSERKATGITTLLGALVLALMPAVGAQAVSTPASGPEAGGVTVTLPAPSVTFAQISGGSDSSLALGDDGNTYGWGANWAGEIGDGTTANRNVPVLTSAPTGVNFTVVSAGDYHSLAIGDDGNAYAWGHNPYGQLGDGTSGIDRHTPVLVDTPPGVTFTHISAGDHHSLAIGDDGNTYAWGMNGYGELGDGTIVAHPSPIQVHTPVGVSFTQISAGYWFSLAVGDDGNTYAWGRNSAGQLGDTTQTARYAPVQVALPTGVTPSRIDTGHEFSIAIGDDGIAYSWGSNSVGELGNGAIGYSTTPAPINTPTGVAFTSISTGWYHSVATGNDGNTYAWGYNGSGQLGDGTTVNSSTAVLVNTPTGVTFTDFGTGYNHSIATGDDGKTYAWGQGSLGQLGNGSFTDSSAPVQVLMNAVTTGITFDGLYGTSLVDNGNGTVSVVAPAHAASTVDVAVEWTLNGVQQPPITYTSDFTYTPPPSPESPAPPVSRALLTITDPIDQRIDDGDAATFTVVTTGSPNPVLTWEISGDNGTTWRTVTAGASAGGHALTVIGTAANDDSLFRATATDGTYSATSAPALLTVSEPIAVVGVSAQVMPPSPMVQTSLIITGSKSLAGYSVLGLLSLLLGASLVSANRLAKHRIAVAQRSSH